MEDKLKEYGLEIWESDNPERQLMGGRGRYGV